MTTLTLEPPVYQFGDIQFSPTSGVIHNGSECILLRAREANLLQALVESFPEVLSRTDIEAKLWKDSYATNATINQTIKALRFSLKDDARTLIRTIPKKGYVLSRIPKIIDEENNNAIAPDRLITSPIEQKSNIDKRHRVSSKQLAGLFALSLTAFCLGLWQGSPNVHERISHQHKEDWYLSNDISKETKRRLSQEPSDTTRYVLRDESGLRVCRLIEEVMTCKNFK